jgi:hypothetical protein
MFGISHLLPAYHGESGFACFRFCWSTLVGEGEDVLSGGWFYYSGLAIANIAFPLLVIALFAAKRIRRFTVFVSVIAFLQVLSWGLLNLAAQPTEFSQIQIGYYLWLLAYGGLVAAHFVKAPVALASTVAAPSNG